MNSTGQPTRGILVIISSPSGAGKTTLSRRLLAEFDNLEFSVSFTTRTPRPNEQDGVDYRFVSGEEFTRMVDAGEFAEWAEVHGNRYGTSQQAVERALTEGRDVVFDVDWQGGKTLSEKWPEDALKIFILPPNLTALEDRLRRRASDSADVIERRLKKAREELTHHNEYQHLVVNDDIDSAYALLRAIYLVRKYTDASEVLKGQNSDSSERGQNSDDVAGGEPDDVTALKTLVTNNLSSDVRARANALIAE